MGNFGLRWLLRLYPLYKNCEFYCVSRSNQWIKNLKRISLGERLFADNNIRPLKYDIAIICTPAISRYRLETLKKVAPLCRGVLIEKPLCLDLNSANKIDASLI